MKCVFCGGRVENKKVTFVYEDEHKCLLVENVPAEVCAQCGEKTYTPDVTDEILKFAKDQFKPARTIRVPVFDFALRT